MFGCFFWLLGIGGFVRWACVLGCFCSAFILDCAVIDLVVFAIGGCILMLVFVVGFCCLRFAFIRLLWILCLVVWMDGWHLVWLLLFWFSVCDGLLVGMLLWIWWFGILVVMSRVCLICLFDWIWGCITIVIGYLSFESVAISFWGFDFLVLWVDSIWVYIWFVGLYYFGFCLLVVCLDFVCVWLILLYVILLWFFGVIVYW